MVIIGAAFYGLLLYGLSYDVRRWFDERAWRRVERRIAERLGVAPPPASVHLDHLQRERIALREHEAIDELQREQATHRKELALQALREHEAKEEARAASAVAEEILAIRGLTHFDERDWR